MVALDNLGRGMASQAVQAMNIALGLDETEDLWQPARFRADQPAVKAARSSVISAPLFSRK